MILKCRTDCRQHDCFCIAAQTFFQNPISTSQSLIKAYTNDKSNQVSIESRYGIKMFFFFSCFSESRDITFPSVCRDLLMAEPSCNRKPEVPAASDRSDPARSTRLTLLTLVSSSSSIVCKTFTIIYVINQNIICLQT